MEKKPQTDEQRLIDYINGLNRRILKLEADKKKQDAKMQELDKKTTRFINLVEGLRSEYTKLKSFVIILKEKIGNLNLANRLRDKNSNLNPPTRPKNK